MLKMQPNITDVPWSVSLSLSRSWALQKMDEPIEMWFGLWT